MSDHSFALQLKGDALSDDEAARLYAALPDATVGSRDGVVIVEIDRYGPTFTDAVVGAILDIERLGHEVLEVDPEDLVFATEIAQRTGRTKESVRLLAEGERGPGDFPAPVRTISGHRLWRWADIAAWFAEYEGKHAPHIAHYSTAVGMINGALALRRGISQLPTVEREAVGLLIRERDLVRA